MKYSVSFGVNIIVEAESEDEAIQKGRDTINSILPSDFVLQEVSEKEEE